MRESLDTLVAAEYLLGESPVWCERTGRLYWVDSRGPAVHWRGPDGAIGSIAMPALVGSFALRERSGAIVALQDGVYRLDLERGTVEPIAEPEPDQPENRFNDGRVDRQGRFWCGTMNDRRRDPTGSLYRIDPDHRWERTMTEIIVPNSLAWSPDGRTMYFADTYRHVIWAFDYDPDGGTPSNRRTLVEVAGPGRPDGSAVDADGCLWNAEYAGGRLVRYTPNGAVDRVISMPVSNPTSCCFGGPGFDTLFVTSARQRLTPEQLGREPLAGSVFALTPGVAGLPEPRFLG
jgi:sugar lactone lactonase YvrE